ncbi:MAG: tautomerase family protein [Polaromonas sp.]|uniref:tautomerase family protein n=1 Tax=Polaromonas sp. TaxID=1869339 RepID=UPI0032635A79
MPLVRIDLPATTPANQVASISDIVHQAMVTTFNVPADDRFQTITRRADDELVCTPQFLDVPHSRQVVFVQIICAPGRSLEMKRALYAAIAREVAAATDIGINDIIINLVETARENWSFGQGLAHYAPVDPKI